MMRAALGSTSGSLERRPAGPHDQRGDDEDIGEPDADVEIGQIVRDPPVDREEDGKGQRGPETGRQKAHVAIGRGERQGRMEHVVEIGEQRIAGELLHPPHPESGAQQESDDAAERARPEPGEEDACGRRPPRAAPPRSPWRTAPRAASGRPRIRVSKPAQRAPQRRVLQRAVRQLLALDHQDGEARSVNRLITLS